MFNFLFDINSSIFKNDLKNIVCSMNITNANGSAIRKKKIDSYLAAIGEAHERRSLLQYNLIPNKNIEAFSLFDNNIQKFSIDYLKEKSILFDSCGCSAYNNSANCIENAFFEFIERQSFIFWYLSKGESYYIEEKTLKNYELYNLYFKGFKAYEISFLESYYVVFFIGELNNRLAVSLGSGKDLNKAITSGLNELNQSYIEFKNAIDISGTELKDYAEVYFSLPTEKVKKAFAFAKEYALKYTERKGKKYISLTNEIKILNKKYQMNPFATFMPLKETRINNIKVCKVFDLNWFPSLLPKSYPKDVYNFVESVTHKKLDRNCTYIPFP